MKAIVYYNYGSPDVLKCEEIEKPIPGDNEVLIKVRAASVNPLDCGLPKGGGRIVTGLLTPKVTRLGVDVAGQVEAVGRNVTQFKAGDEVFGACIRSAQASGVKAWTCQGAFAEYACAPESTLVLKPDNVTFEQAASVPVAAFTALQGLRDRGHIQPGQNLCGVSGTTLTGVASCASFGLHSLNRIPHTACMALSSKLWFRLQKLKAALGSKEQSYDSAHRMCPNCRALIERGASECPLCGASVKPPRSRASSTPGRVLGGIIPVPSTATSALVAANLALYAISWYLTQNLASAELNAAPSMGGIDLRVLIRLGAKFGPYMVAGQWWRLVTAVFLHAGLFHIGMNLWCLFDLGPAVESLFSTTKFIFFYLVAGVAGFILSFLWSPLVTSVGASGAILGLIGVLIGASFHHGGLGRDMRSQLWRWVIYILIFGIFFSVDNAAHIGGLGAGFLLGYIVQEGEPTTRASENLWNTLAVLCVLAIAGSFALMALQLIRPVR